MGADAQPVPREPARRDNGLSASTWVPLADIDPEIGERLLTALRQARIPAYLEPAGEPERERLFVASADRADARTVVQAAARGAGEDVQAPDLLDGVDTDAAFAAIVADWHVDTIAAVRSAERDLTREDSDWRARLEPGFPAEPAADDDDDEDEEHYVPPAPPPLPRLATATMFALALLVTSIAVLVFGGLLGLDGDFTFLLGVAGVLVSVGLLIMRLRSHPPDDDDDGAVV